MYDNESDLEFCRHLQITGLLERANSKKIKEERQGIIKHKFTAVIIMLIHFILYFDERVENSRPETSQTSLKRISCVQSPKLISHSETVKNISVSNFGSGHVEKVFN